MMRNRSVKKLPSTLQFIAHELRKLGHKPYDTVKHLHYKCKFRHRNTYLTIDLNQSTATLYLWWAQPRHHLTTHDTRDPNINLVELAREIHKCLTNPLTYRNVKV